jgi:hypothetical protein
MASSRWKDVLETRLRNGRKDVVANAGELSAVRVGRRVHLRRLAWLSAKKRRNEFIQPISE